MRATSFDKKFDADEDITELLDLTKAKRISEAHNMAQKKKRLKKYKN